MKYSITEIIFKWKYNLYFLPTAHVGVFYSKRVRPFRWKLVSDIRKEGIYLNARDVDIPIHRMI